MLKILAVQCTGMFSFGWMPVINLDNRGRILISGRNGTGKSSILNCIKEIIFGKNDTGKSGINIINKHSDWDRGCFGVVWCIDRENKTWRIMNIRKWKDITYPQGIDGPSQHLSLGGTYTGDDIFIEMWDGNQWIDMRPTASRDNKSINDAKQFIIDYIFHMTYDQFSAYVCLGQSAESALVLGTSGAREKIIQAVTDVTIWTNAAEITKAAYINKDTELANLNSEINGRKNSLDHIILPTEQDIQEAVRSVQVIEDNYKGLCQAVATVQQQISEFQMKQSTIDDVEQELQILVAEERHSRERYENFEPPPEPEKISAIHNQILILQAENRNDLTTVNHYQTVGEGVCSNCGQVVDQEHLKKEIKRLTDLISDRGFKVDALYEDHNRLVAAYEKAVEEAKAAAKLKMEEELHYLEESKQRQLAKKKEYQDILSAIEHLNEKLSYLNNEIKMAPTNISIAKIHLASLQSKINEVEQIEAGIQHLETQAASMTNEILHLKWTERNLKKIRIQEYEAAIDRLNQLLADRLYELWGPGLFARFVTARNTTRGKGVVSGLNFIVDTEKKTDIPIEMCSGGQKKIIVIATFLAMIQLSIERGLGVNITAVDELDENLDDVNADKLVEAFESITELVSTCLIISHNTRLLNTMTFDERWTTHMENEISTLEIGKVSQITA